MFNKGQLSGLMKQAQQMQQKMLAAQDELANILVTGESPNNAVKITMTCKHVVKKIEINDAVLLSATQDADDKDLLQDYLIMAFNKANEEAEQQTQKRMGPLTQGMNLPF
jgi:DNA-binding YbaB/EbfC family protein